MSEATRILFFFVHRYQLLHIDIVDWTFDAIAKEQVELFRIREWTKAFIRRMGGAGANSIVMERC